MSNKSDLDLFYRSRNIEELLKKIPSYTHNKWLKKSLKSLAKLVKRGKIDRLEWKILTGTLKDLEKGFRLFSNYRNTRKITIFGSARTTCDTPEYDLALKFAQKVSQEGFMVLTGAGGGIMEAGNKGAGTDNSFGLNVKLPFEQSANNYIENDHKLINFKYFFTRKLFFLKETDAIALFPGGFGTQDEAFETLTLCQTGRQPPIPLILIDKPGGNYWQNWQQYIIENLVSEGYINPEDKEIYTITDNVDTAYEIISKFYRVYHSSLYRKDFFVMRLNCQLKDEQINILNDKFSDILTQGKITKIESTDSQSSGTIDDLPSIGFYFNERKFSRIYQMINIINSFELDTFACHQPYIR
ncbi:LOG family protein [Cyanobacterium stanieri LEGE 03274]|uniref:LOG family protein n=1 Tax=Cyanobacterium stanieri LEGE 03274 TaxID=1828756 RepID=A0ABR9V5D4_9CHRO|nr:LOG family protein [Cyanobacterium stanieri]MBE9223100.1 LOG family protein [Cyanobacterium stanieri LEGE 03274]